MALGLVLAATAAGLGGCTGRSGPTEPGRLAPGVWGADGANLTVASDHALLELSCAQGTITGPLVVGEAGAVQADGTFGRVGGAPPPDGIFPSYAARYTGRLAGDALTLSILVPATAQELGPFVLRKGQHGRIIYCP
ncbi:MAG TPA: hypothetical protein VFQ38_17170 [Longimicrobiales bacterium]|nr:hypothetical protein [Longimicrobiales bacterium]